MLDRLRQRDVQTVAVLSCVVAHLASTDTRHGRAAVRAAGTHGEGAWKRLLPSEHDARHAQCRQVYADVLKRWGLIIPLAELTKFGPPTDRSTPTGRTPAFDASSVPVAPSGTIHLACIPAPTSPARRPRTHSVGSPSSLASAAPNAAAVQERSIRACPSSSSCVSGHGCWYVGSSEPPVLPSRAGRGVAEAQERALCAVCHLRVRGLSWYCGSCGHGGHLDCMRQWMGADGAHGVCPTGCGCCCLHVEPDLELEPWTKALEDTSADAAAGKGPPGTAPAQVPLGATATPHRDAALQSRAEISTASDRDRVAGGAVARMRPSPASAAASSPLSVRAAASSTTRAPPLLDSLSSNLGQLLRFGPRGNVRPSG